MVNFVKDATGQSATATFKDESERDQANADLTRQELTTITGFRPNGDVEVGNHFLITIKANEFAYAEKEGHVIEEKETPAERAIQSSVVSPVDFKHSNTKKEPLFDL